MKRAFLLVIKVVSYLALAFVISGIAAVTIVSATGGCPRFDEGAIQCTAPIYETLGGYGMLVLLASVFTGLPAGLALAGLVFLIRDVRMLVRGQQALPPPSLAGPDVGARSFGIGSRVMSGTVQEALPPSVRGAREPALNGRLVGCSIKNSSKQGTRNPHLAIVAGPQRQGQNGANAPTGSKHMTSQHLRVTAMAASLLIGSAAMVFAQAPSGGASGGSSGGATSGGSSTGGSSSGGSSSGGAASGGASGGGARSGTSGGGASTSGGSSGGAARSGGGSSGAAAPAERSGASGGGSSGAAAPTERSGASGGGERSGAPGGATERRGGDDSGRAGRTEGGSDRSGRVDGESRGDRGGRASRREGGGTTVRVEAGSRGGYRGRTVVRDRGYGVRRNVTRMVYGRPRYDRRVVIRGGPRCTLRITRIRTAFGTRVRKVRVCRR